MNYEEDKVMEAFHLYTKLARDGVADKEAVEQFAGNEEVRTLIERFAGEVQCVVVHTSEKLYMIPETQLSPFHVSNDWVKRTYLHSSAVNADIYLLYFATMVLFGMFFDRYNSPKPTLDFTTLSDWVEAMNERIGYLKSHDEEHLKEMEREFSYNWRAIIDKWDALDDIKETAKKQTGNTVSRLSFMDTTKRFLVREGLLKDIGNYEVTITEKARVIIQKFFMNVAYNNNIFEFMYEKEAMSDADDQ